MNGKQLNSLVKQFILQTTFICRYKRIYSFDIAWKNILLNKFVIIYEYTMWEQ